MAEPRSAVMIVAEAWWEGPDGLLQRGPVRIVNKSPSGACVRVKSRIDVGARLRIQSRWDEFCARLGRRRSPNRARRSFQIGKAASARKARWKNAAWNLQKSQKLWRASQIVRKRQRW